LFVACCLHDRSRKQQATDNKQLGYRSTINEEGNTMPANKDCLFCRIIAGEIPSKKVFEDDAFFAFRDINPQAPVHVLLIPKKHIPMLSALERCDGALMGALVLRAAEIARQEGISESGYRVVVNNGESASQSVLHIHAHILGGRNFGWPPG
jgi:histidine triad (HIT) family protein